MNTTAVVKETVLWLNTLGQMEKNGHYLIQELPGPGYFWEREYILRVTNVKPSCEAR